MLLKIRLYRTKVFKGSNTYAEPILKWTREDERNLDPRMKKLINMHKYLPQGDDTERLNAIRNEGLCEFLQDFSNGIC